MNFEVRLSAAKLIPMRSDSLHKTEIKIISRHPYHLKYNIETTWGYKDQVTTDRR
jgi:hypothetical protein